MRPIKFKKRTSSITQKNQKKPTKSSPQSDNKAIQILKISTTFKRRLTKVREKLSRIPKTSINIQTYLDVKNTFKKISIFLLTYNILKKKELQKLFRN